jgi:hypothetical protein
MFDRTEGKMKHHTAKRGATDNEIIDITINEVNSCKGCKEDPTIDTAINKDVDGCEGRKSLVAFDEAKHASLATKEKPPSNNVRCKKLRRQLTLVMVNGGPLGCGSQDRVAWLLCLGGALHAFFGHLHGFQGRIKAESQHCILFPWNHLPKLRVKLASSCFCHLLQFLDEHKLACQLSGGNRNTTTLMQPGVKKDQCEESETPEVLMGCSRPRWPTRLPECDIFCVAPNFQSS